MDKYIVKSETFISQNQRHVIFTYGNHLEELIYYSTNKRNESKPFFKINYFLMLYLVNLLTTLVFLWFFLLLVVGFSGC